MPSLREAATQALEALESLFNWQVDPERGKRCGDAVVALRAALAEPEPPPEAQTEAKKIAYCAGWWDALAKARKAEPVQEPVAWIHTDPEKGRVKFLEWRENEPGYRGDWIKTPLYTAPPQRKPPATIDEMFDRMDKAPRGVFSGHDPMTMWMEAWRAAEQHHGI